MPSKTQRIKRISSFLLLMMLLSCSADSDSKLLFQGDPGIQNIPPDVYLDQILGGVPPAKFVSLRFVRITRWAESAFSTKTAWCPPRLRASIPTAPVPANKSNRRVSIIQSPKMLKSASLTRSVMGRVTLPGTV